MAKVAKFRIGSRAIRTRQWSDVAMTESKQNLYGDNQTGKGKLSTAAIEKGRESAAVLQALVQAISTGDSAGLETEGLGFKTQPATRRR